MESVLGGVKFPINIGKLISLLSRVNDRLELPVKTVSPLTFVGVAGELTIIGVTGEILLSATTDGELRYRSNVTSHSLACIFLESQYLILFSRKYSHKFYESRARSRG